MDTHHTMRCGCCNNGTVEVRVDDAREFHPSACSNCGRKPLCMAPGDHAELMRQHDAKRCDQGAPASSLGAAARMLILVTLAVTSSHAGAIAGMSSEATDFLVRIGQERRYYEGCTVNTNILEPGDASASHLVVSSCTATDVIVPPPTPSWIVDRQASYGGVYFSGEALGECWLIQQQLIANASRAMTIECSETLLDSGFEAQAD